MAEYFPVICGRVVPFFKTSLAADHEHQKAAPRASLNGWEGMWRKRIRGAQKGDLPGGGKGAAESWRKGNGYFY